MEIRKQRPPIHQLIQSWDLVPIPTLVKKVEKGRRAKEKTLPSSSWRMYVLTPYLRYPYSFLDSTRLCVSILKSEKRAKRASSEQNGVEQSRVE